MSTDRTEVAITVTYDATCGYIATAPELRQPIVALSLGSLRRRIEAALCPTTATCGSSSTPSPRTAGRSRRAEPDIYKNRGGLSFSQRPHSSSSPPHRLARRLDPQGEAAVVVAAASPSRRPKY